MKNIALFIFLILLSCQTESKITSEGYLLNIEKGCDCKGRSGKSIDDLLVTILPPGSYDSGYNSFEKIISDEVFEKEILKAIELDFNKNENFCKCFNSKISNLESMFTNSEFSYEEEKKFNKKLDSLFMSNKKYSCYRFLPALITVCDKK